MSPPVMSGRRGLILGAAATLLGRSLLIQLMLVKLRRDLNRLNAGDYKPLLAGYADDAVLHFNDGAHRWAGDHRGKAAIERFLRDFTAAGLRGEILSLWISGPPWAMTLALRFDDHAETLDGSPVYENRTVLVAHTRWGRIVEQWDFYEDTGRILTLEEHLRERDVAPVR